MGTVFQGENKCNGKKKWIIKNFFSMKIALKKEKK